MRRGWGGAVLENRKWWRRRQLTETERKDCDDVACREMGGSSSRWEGRLAAPRFIEREGYGKIGATSIVGGRRAQESGRRFRERLQSEGLVLGIGLGSAQLKVFEMAGKRRRKERKVDGRSWALTGLNLLRKA